MGRALDPLVIASGLADTQPTTRLLAHAFATINLAKVCPFACRDCRGIGS